MISRRRKSTPLPLPSSNSETSTTDTDEEKGKYSARAITQYIMYSLVFLISFVSRNTIGYTIGHALSSYYAKFSADEFANPRYRPSDWETWSYHDMHEHSCEDYNNDHPVPSLEYWNFLRTKYIEVVDPSYKFDDKVPPTQGYSTDEKGTPPFYYAKVSPGKGRGLYASRDIKKGEAFDDGSYVGTIFPDGMAFRRFFFSLPKDMQCDVTMWMWTQQFEKDGPVRIVVPFEISGLLNGSKTDFNAVADNEFSTVDIATRDIKKDEEIIVDYSIYPDRWRAVGLG